MSRDELGSDYVQSLARGLKVLTAFSREQPRMSLSEVARATELTRATARRLLITLEHLGYVDSDGRQFRLTPQVLDIGYAYLSSLGVDEVAEPYMEELVEQLQESSSATVLDDTQIVYVARVPTKRIMTVSLGLGSRLPAYCTSMGRVLLAHLAPDDRDHRLDRSEIVAHTAKTVTDRAELVAILDQVREDGYALVDGELEIGVRSIAAPLRDRNGRVVAAMNVSTHPSRVTLDQLRGEFLPALVETAKRVSEQLARR